MRINDDHHRFKCDKCSLSFDMTPDIRSEYYCPYCGYEMSLNPKIDYEQRWEDLFKELGKCNNKTTSRDIYWAMEHKDFSKLRRQ